MRELLVYELERLWGELREARRRALTSTGWSIEAEDKRDRIVEISRVVGPTPWKSIDVDLLLDGTYQTVYDEAGVEYPEVDMKRAREVRAFIDRGGLADSSVRSTDDK